MDADGEAALGLQQEIIELLQREVAELRAQVADRDARIEQLLLAEGLRQWRPARKRPGAPKRRDVADDLEALRMLEGLQRQFGLKTRASTLDYVIEKAEQERTTRGLPRRNVTRLAQERKTLLNRVSAASRKRPDK